MQSYFKNLSDLALGVTQGFFGEDIIYKVGLTETSLKAVFEVQPVEVNGVSAQALTCQIQSKDLATAPQKNDKVIRGAKTYTVSAAQIESDGSIYTLVLKD